MMEPAAMSPTEGARALVVVIDACGVGALPDAADYGDEGTNTLAHVAEAVGGLDVPAMQALGLGNIMPLRGCPPRRAAPTVHGRLAERSLGMDTTTGHWEMAGIITERPFPTYPDGFPAEVIEAFSKATGRPVIGNVAASGTEIIKRLGEEHQRTGAWIVYTSADSVFQIAAHEGTIPLEELYEACRVARRMLVGEHAVGRVIARPFEGEPGAYVRTPRRHDFSLEPPSPNYLERLRAGGVTVHGVGKISDIFAGRDMDSSRPTTSNGHGIAVTTELLRTLPDHSFVFTNLVETDMLWGHRNEPRGFADALEEFDAGLPDILAALRHGDLLVLTSDHGCDPTTPSTDHSREYALLLAHVPGAPLLSSRHDGDTFADVGATVMRVLTHERAPDLPGTPVL
jgi:phosphopentomutase